MKKTPLSKYLSPNCKEDNGHKKYNIDFQTLISIKKLRAAKIRHGALNNLYIKSNHYLENSTFTTVPAPSFELNESFAP